MPQEKDSTLRFHNPSAFVGLTGVVDVPNAVIKGVSLISMGEAEGHGLTVDQITLQQLLKLATAKGQIPVNLDHGSGIVAMNGFINNFRIDGTKLRGDWNLLKTHDDTPTMLERADRQAGTFGLSAAFGGPKEGVLHLGKKCARAHKLLSFDVVVRPAANEGLFSVKDDNLLTNDNNTETQFTMPSENQPTLQDLMAAIQGLTQQVQAQQQTIDQLSQGDGPSLQDLANATNDELLAAGYTQEEINDLDVQINEAIASGELVQGDGEGTGEGEGAGTGEGEGSSEGSTGGEGAGVGAGVGGGAEGSAAFRALQKDFIELKSKIDTQELSAQEQAEMIELDALNQHITFLAAQRDEAVELAEGYRSEVEALRLAVRTGTRPARPGIDDGNRLMSANENGDVHQFTAMVQQLVAGGKTEGQAITELSASQPALKQDWLEFLAKGRK